jgi:hypothetical protein
LIPRNKFRKAHTLYRHNIKYLNGVAGNLRNKVQQYSLNKRPHNTHKDPFTHLTKAKPQFRIPSPTICEVICQLRDRKGSDFLR